MRCYPNLRFKAEAHDSLDGCEGHEHGGPFVAHEGEELPLLFRRRGRRRQTFAGGVSLIVTLGHTPCSVIRRLLQIGMLREGGLSHVSGGLVVVGGIV